MGTWSLLSATPDIRDRNDVYGHFFAMKFRFKYSSSVMGAFTEMPRLEWKETITMVEKNAGSLPEGQWFRECKVGSISRPFSTTGFRKVEPPADVSIVKPFVGGTVSGTYE